VNENLIKPFVLAKVLKKCNLTTQNKQQLVLLSKRKTTSWPAIHRLGRKIEFKQSVVDKQQNQLQQK
tara:strand:- start:105 stop:305 length:201 start_codon:yes stop_codon:yes gene_type:complete